MKSFANSLNVNAFFAVERAAVDERFGEIAILRSKSNAEKRIFCKEKLCASAEEFALETRAAETRAALVHSNVLRMLAFETESERRVRCYYEYFPRSLADELARRRVAAAPFAASALRALANDLLFALAFLQSAEVVHGFVSPTMIALHGENFKLVDRLFACAPSLSALQREHAKGAPLYASPSLYAALCLGRPPSHNAFKSESFALGMVLLETALLASAQTIYDARAAAVDAERLSELCEAARGALRDAPEVAELICFALRVEERFRATPRELAFWWAKRTAVCAKDAKEENAESVLRWPTFKGEIADGIII